MKTKNGRSLPFFVLEVKFHVIVVEKFHPLIAWFLIGYNGKKIIMIRMI